MKYGSTQIGSMTYSGMKMETTPGPKYFSTFSSKEARSSFDSLLHKTSVKKKIGPFREKSEGSITTNPYLISEKTLNFKGAGLTDGEIGLLDLHLRSQHLNLELLDLSYNKFGDFGPENIFYSFHKPTSTATYKIKIINFSCNSITDSGAKTMANYLKAGCFPELSALYLGGNKITLTGEIALIDAIDTGKNDMWLFLNQSEGNPWAARPEFAKWINLTSSSPSGTIIKDKPDLLSKEKVIDLSNQRLKNSELNWLVEHFKYQKLDLDTLNLSGNLFNQCSVDNMFCDFRNIRIFNDRTAIGMTKIKYMNLSNGLLTDQSAKTISRWLPHHPDLRVLNLIGNKITETGEKELIKTVSEGAQTIKVVFDIVQGVNRYLKINSLKQHIKKAKEYQEFRGSYSNKILIDKDAFKYLKLDRWENEIEIGAQLAWGIAKCATYAGSIDSSTEESALEAWWIAAKALGKTMSLPSRRAELALCIAFEVQSAMYSDESVNIAFRELELLGADE